MKRIFKVGETVVCINNKILTGNDYGPPLEIDTFYVVEAIVEDKAGNQHLDVGLESHLNYVSSYETGEHLPLGEKIHWCHPSRFE